MNYVLFLKILATFLLLSALTNIYWWIKGEPNLRKMAFFQAMLGKSPGKIAWIVTLIILPIICAILLFTRGFTF